MCNKHLGHSVFFYSSFRKIAVIDQNHLPLVDVQDLFNADENDHLLKNNSSFMPQAVAYLQISRMWFLVSFL